MDSVSLGRTFRGSLSCERSVRSSWELHCGAIARRRGGAIGVITALPSAIVWSGVAILGWTGSWLMGWDAGAEPASLGNRIMAAILAVIIPFIGFKMGQQGAEMGQQNRDHFESRRWTLLGIRWYHYLWIPIPLTLVTAQIFWVLLHYWRFVVSTWMTNPLLAIFPAILCGGLFYSLNLSAEGLGRAYMVLAGFSPSQRAARDVLKFGCGFQIVAILIQTAIGALLYGVAKAFPSLGG